MSSLRYQVRLRVYNIDKTKLTTTTRARIFSSVAAANNAAHDWLKDFRSEDEVIRIKGGKGGGMSVFAASNLLKEDDNISAWAETVRFEENNEENSEGGMRGEERANKGGEDDRGSEPKAYWRV